jgi:hypothetical protein
LRASTYTPSIDVESYPPETDGGLPRAIRLGKEAITLRHTSYNLGFSTSIPLGISIVGAFTALAVR